MSYFVTLGIILFLYMNFWFVVSLLMKRNDVADVAWGLGFVLLAWVSLFISETNSILGIIVTLFVTVWGLRLAWHVHSRNKGKTEDYRYLAWRKQWGKWFYMRSYAQVYMLQGTLLFLIALPVLVIYNNLGGDVNILAMLGIVVWIIGFFFEVVGDSQLARFIKNKDNQGKLMTTGLWRYTRHPNYFGEVMQWWGIWLIALSVSGGWLGIIGPITITFLILLLSGKIIQALST